MSEDRILDFLDGRLSGSAEEELLHTLAVSPERRQMLRDHLRLRELTSNLSRQERFAVPEHVSQQLFTKLTALGFAAPPTTAAILTHAKDYVKRDKPTERRKTAIWTGRRMAGSLATVSIISFLLGVSAFYVFGERLGIHTLSTQRSASIVSPDPVHGLTSHKQFASAMVDLAQPAAPMAAVRSVVHDAPIFGASLFASRDMSAGLDLGTSDAGLMPQASKPIERQIMYTAPMQTDDEDLLTPSSITSQYIFNSRMHRDPFESFPFLSEKGTISFRFGTGRPIRNTTREWSSLSELKFTWALGKFMTARASLGQLMTYEREAQGPPNVPVISTVPTQKIIPVAGVEVGVALDELGVPVELSAGAMTDGAVRFYPRAALLAHYDLLPSLSLGVGIEGLAYKHDISASVNDKKNTFKDLKPIVDPGSLTTKETAGFVGLAFELGWHF
jgi:hypothetical protein